MSTAAAGQAAADISVRLLVTVTLYGGGSGEDAAQALRGYNGTFELPDGREAEILDAQPAGGIAPDGARWHGWLLTLNCGHLELTDRGDRQPGQVTTCDMCPLTTHSPDAPGRPARQLRVIVSRAPAEAPAEPATLDPAYWYTT